MFRCIFYLGWTKYDVTDHLGRKFPPHHFSRLTFLKHALTRPKTQVTFRDGALASGLTTSCKHLLNVDEQEKTNNPVKSDRMTSWQTHPQECPRSACTSLFKHRCEGPSLRSNTCGIIAAQPETRLTETPTRSSGREQHPSLSAGEIPSLYPRGDWKRWGCTSMSSPLWPWGRVIGWEQWSALFAYSVASHPHPPSPSLPYLIFTLYSTQLKIELTLACGHPTSPHVDPALLHMYVCAGRLKLQRFFSHMMH